MYENEINKALQTLNEEKILVYPTDTVWGLGCDATSEKAVSRIFEIKQRKESKSLIILVDSIDMLRRYLSNIPENVLSYIGSLSNPTTVIYENPNGLAKNVIANDNTVAIRWVQDDFCRDLIARFGKPIVSTSANISESPTPMRFKEIDTSILDSVDYVVNLYREKVNTKPSTIIKIGENGKLIVLRK
jgi:L-threonylcarbamoyladenylate synthase